MKKINSYTFIVLLGIVFFSCKKENNTPKLEASISGNAIEIFAGESVTFNDSSSGKVSRWKWTFEGGQPQTSELSSPTITYNTPGTYNVTLEVSDINGTNLIKKDGFVTVKYNRVVTDFTAEKQIIRQGESIQFRDISTGMPGTWAWEFKEITTGAVITSALQNPLITFEQPGKYTVKLKAANAAYNDEKIKDAFIEVIDITFVSADFKSTNSATYAGGKINFQDASLGTVTTYNWTFEGGTPATSNVANPVITYATPGRYKVKLHVANTVKNSEKEIAAYVLVVPSADLKAFISFNNSVNDAGPLAIPVTHVGGVSFTEPDRNGLAGGTGVFDGASGIHLQSAGLFEFGVGDFTISGWTKTASSARMMLWQESGKNGTGDNQSWIRLNDNATDRYLRFNTEYSGGSSILNMGTEGKLNDNVWKHVVAVRSGTKMTVYINGGKVKELTTPEARNVTGAGQGFKIGFQEGTSSYSNYFNGLIDDFIIYKRALTETEIKYLYTL